MIHFAGHLLSIATFLMTIVFVAILLRARKSPSSTWAWIIGILLIPYVGIPLFLLFGTRKLNPSEDSEVRLATLPRSLDRIRWTEDGKVAFEDLTRLIRTAEKSIDLSTFVFKKDAVGSEIVSELEKKAREGVRVRILIDAFGTPARSRPSFKKLREAGGEVEYFEPFFKWPFRGFSHLRNHRKIAIFDGKTAYVGGMNVAEEYLGPTRLDKRWVDLAVAVEGQNVHALQEIFDSDWKWRRGEPHRLQRLSLGPESINGSVTQLVASGPDVKGDPLYDTILESFFEASKRIWIATPYFIPDESLLKALVLACRRGVDVRLLIPKRSNHFVADLSRGGYLRELSEEGGKIFLYPKMMHAKLVLVDDRFSVLGSANLDVRSLLYNFEIGLFLFSAQDLEKSSHWMRARLAESSVYEPVSSWTLELIEGVGRTLGPLL